MTWYLVVRWLHIFTAASWFGEVITINFVLVPAVRAMDPNRAQTFLVEVFPRIFKLASYLSATVLITGFYMAWQRFAATPEVLWTTGSGRAFLVGATLGTVLTIFHFVLEPRLDGMICTAAERGDLEVSNKVIRLLTIVPRAGLAVIGGALLLMMIGARGL